MISSTVIGEGPVEGKDGKPVIVTILVVLSVGVGGFLRALASGLSPKKLVTKVSGERLKISLEPITDAKFG
jgi:hypothetical protein